MNLHIQLYKNWVFFLSSLFAVTTLAFLFSKNFSNTSTNDFYHSQLKFVNLTTTEAETFLSDFNPNQLSKEQWINLGFSDKQAETILKYKKIVGGNFTSKSQLKKCYSISEAKFEKLAPYILLPNESTDFYAYKGSNSGKKLIVTRKFNPDTYSESDWIKMGFSEKQASTLLKYKKMLGGSFTSKEKFSECFVISEDHFKLLKPYLLLPDKKDVSSYPKQKKTITVKQNFDPNVYELNDWTKLGFTEKQAQTILNYKTKFLKGKIKSAEDLKECFAISEENFDIMKPYIKISDSRNDPTPSKTNSDFSQIDLNKISYAQLLEFGFEEKAAGSFIGFRKKLGGFVNEKQILETYHIDVSLAQRLIESTKLKNDDIEKHLLIDAPEEWLKNHPYFRYYADKILFFRITYKTDKEILKRLNIKKEQEEKMKLYLK